MVQPAQRLQKMQRYVFEELFLMRDAAARQGVDVIDLGVGNPDGRPPAFVGEALYEAVRREAPNRHRYSSFNCLPELRAAVADWYRERFGVVLDPATQVQPLIGSKEGLYHLMQAYLDQGNTILVPTPCYPAYLGASRLCEANIVEMPLLEENGFRVDLSRIPTEAAKAAKMLLLNYPGNPTGGVCDLDHYRDVLAFCRDHDILLVSDIAYSELSLEDDHDPRSVLELPGALEQAVEFQSLSKSHSMAGWRVGFCCGAPGVISNLLKLKSNVDFGIFMAVQEAAIAALREGKGFVEENRQMYRARRDLLCEGLRGLGWEITPPRAGMYVWTRLPRGHGEDDWAFVRRLFEASGVLISPGSAFGETGRGYVRMSLVVGEDRLREVVARIGDSGVLAG